MNGNVVWMEARPRRAKKDYHAYSLLEVASDRELGSHNRLSWWNINDHIISKKTQLEYTHYNRGG